MNTAAGNQPSDGNSTGLEQARADYESLRSQDLSLNMQRGQPSDADFDLSNEMLTCVGIDDTVVDGIDIRNYAGGMAGLPSARRMFADYLDLAPDQVVVWNNASLELQSFVLTFALLHGRPSSLAPWAGTGPRMIVTTPGYDRHFVLLETLGFELIEVGMQSDGPDMDAVEEAAADPAVKGILFVPTYSNPTGDTISRAKAERLMALDAAAPDFTVLADDAYRAHHLGKPDPTVNLVELAAAAGNPDRAFVFASTSKITFAGSGLGFVGTSEANVAWLTKYLGAQSIGPNKVEQARHVAFLSSIPDGIDGLMAEHAKLIAPKFEAVDRALTDGLGTDGNYARWSTPNGGYFISMDVAEPVADKVVELAAAAGVSLTPAGATYPGDDPGNANIRIAPTRPPLEEVEQAMAVVAACVRLAVEEYRAGGS